MPANTVTLAMLQYRNRKIELLRKEVRRLNEALVRYGEHKSNCWFLIKYDGVCTCGLSDERGDKE